MTTVNTLHRVYCDLTGLEIGHSYARDYAWNEFIKRGWGVEDLTLVISEIQRGIENRVRYPMALRFSRLIEDPDRFDEELAEAKANMRNRRPKPTNRDRVLAQSGRATETTGTALPVKTVIHNVAKATELTDAGKAALEAFAKLKDELK